VLTASGLGYRLPTGRTLFEHVELRLDPGDAIAISGPSGTGKSTLLWLLGNLLTPTAGRVDISADHPQPYAWVLQGLNVLSARTLLDNSALCNTIDGVPPRVARTRATEAVDALGLTSLARTRLRNVSGGELQRATVARALASTRPVILADEPTNQLDRDNARLVMELLDNERHHNRVVVIVTHDTAALPSTIRRAELTPGGLVE